MKKFLHIFIFALILTILFCIGASAAEWTDKDGRTWTFTTTVDNSSATPVNVATITGAKLKEGEKRTSELNIPSEVFVGDEKYIVTKIGEGAFRCLVSGKGQDDLNGNTESGAAGANSLKKIYFGHLTIPNTVKEIGAKAFEYSLIYGTVEIPDSVTTIGSRAFRGCVGLDTVIWPSNISTVPSNCFEGSKALVEFRSRGKIETFSSSSLSGCQALLNVYYAPLVENDKGELVEAPVEPMFKYVKKIDSNAFYNTSISGELDLSALESLGASAFYNCNFLTKVTLGTCDFRRDAFNYDSNKTSSLREIIISEANTKYCTVNNVVFSKDMKTIYYYAPAKFDTNYAIPDTVEKIESYSFYKAKFTRVDIPASVQTINQNAFEGSQIANLYVPSTVKTVGSNIVTNCPLVEWVIFDAGVETVKTDSVSTGSCPKLRSRAFVKNGKTAISGAITYVPNSDCTEITEIGAHFYGYVDNAPTCDTAGEYKCCLCDIVTPAKALGHKGKIVASSKLTCTTNESFTVDCDNCGLVKENIITACSGHTLSAPINVTNAKYSGSFAMCTTCKNIILDGFSTDTFDSGDINDDGSINETDVLLLGKILAGGAVVANRFACDINADGSVTVADLMLLKQYVKNGTDTIAVNTGVCANHVHIKTVVLHKESCVDGGGYVYFCADCGEIIKQENGALYEQIEAKGHLFTDTTTKAATCSVEGSMNRVCSVCNHTETASIPTIDHQFNWWMLGDDDLDFQYGYCSICNVLGHQEVNRGVLDAVVAAIPTDYELYCTAESRSVLRPIVSNANKALTQEQVDLCIQEIRRVLPTIQYKVNDIPIIYLEARGAISKTYCPATIIVAYKDDNGNLKSITDAEGQMRLRGNATAGVTAKQPYKIKFSREVDLFGLGASKNYILLANALDTSTIRNAAAFTFAQNLGLDYTCKFEFVEVYSDGKYRGCYNLVTVIEIGENRVDIDEEKDVIIHLSYKNGNEKTAFPSPIFGFSLMRLEEPTEYTPYTKSQMIRIMHQADFAILSGDMDEMAKVMDVDSMLKYFIFHEYVKDMDMIWDSTRFYIEDGKLHGGPCWDLDISQGNVAVQTSRNNGLDEHSGYHYWNQEIVYGGIVTRAELDKLGKLASAIGPWADAFWANDKSNGTSNPTLQNGQRRWWYSYMIEYSSEFRVAVAQFIKDNESIFKAMYESVTDPVTGKTTDCVIDDLAFGRAGEAIIRNYTAADAPFGPAHNPNSITYGADDTHQASVDYLRAWWKTRCEWLYNYYTTNFLPAN